MREHVTKCHIIFINFTDCIVGFVNPGPQNSTDIPSHVPYFHMDNHCLIV